jgi:curved DNA-binding protein CbpA
MAGSVSPSDPFEILGVRPDATPDQIRAAYRDLVARFHPDKHRGNPLEELAAAKLVEINRAYELLSDDERRAEYEAGRRRRPPPTSARPPAPSAAPARVARPTTVGMKLVRSLGLIVTLLFFLRFGLALGREILVVIRGFVVGVLWILRLSPVLAIAVIMAIALGAGYFLRSRKGDG